jgi:hypothetical protein
VVSRIVSDTAFAREGCHFDFHSALEDDACTQPTRLSQLLDIGSRLAQLQQLRYTVTLTPLAA